MKASDLEKDPVLPDDPANDPAGPTAGGWLRVMGAGLAIVGVCILWTFWV
jgi:hypothetical protein